MLDTVLQVNNFQITTLDTGEPWCQNCYIVRDLQRGEQLLIDPGDNADERLMRQAHTYALVFDDRHIKPFSEACCMMKRKNLN